MGDKPKKEPKAFFCLKLSTPMINHDIGNSKLLVLKLTLKEWRHWLEGAAQLFLVLTDHKIYSIYIQSRLNSR